MSPLCSTAPSHTYTCLYTSLTCPPQISILVYSYSWVQLPTERFQTMINLLYHIFSLSFVYKIFSPHLSTTYSVPRSSTRHLNYSCTGIVHLQYHTVSAFCSPRSSTASAVLIHLKHLPSSYIYHILCSRVSTSAASLLIIYTTSAVIVNKLNNHICSHC